MYMLDTDVVSALRRPDRLPQQVVDWASASDADDFFLSAISVLEIEQGILAKARSDKAQGEMLRTWFDSDVLAKFEDRILPVDTAVARRCAQLHVPDRRPERDALIAATALVHGLSVVTRNAADFEPTGVAVINPWSMPAD